MARKPFISGNWKLNPQSKEEAITLSKDIAASITDKTPESDIALFVPYVFIESAMDSVDGKINVGAEVRSFSSTNRQLDMDTSARSSLTEKILFLFADRVSALKSLVPLQEPCLPPCSSPSA